MQMFYSQLSILTPQKKCLICKLPIYDGSQEICLVCQKIQNTKTEGLLDTLAKPSVVSIPQISPISQTELEGSEILEELFCPEFCQEGITYQKEKQIFEFNTGSKLCGKKIYQSGFTQIDFQILNFPQKAMEWNEVKIGVIESSSRKMFLNKKGFFNCYYFETYWDGNKSYSWRCKNYEQEEYIKPIKTEDKISIILNQDKNQISFCINNETEVAWDNIPKQVSIFLYAKPKRSNKIRYLVN
ncbi:hypothetical protein M0813_04315 [Anaeramoeba flamelloides]|uniref:SPRY domain-containing protein n=1 Tax=Anaeramoeba flamelloides TaxID=1746091 RepID=A0ABQ8XK58_9EUKA|nr:hypothetical protein M0813_04315 [Anaeramoeba flamelloides]